MKEYHGLWLPDDEFGMVSWMTRNPHFIDGIATFQIDSIHRALEVQKKWRNAIDIGSNIGMWSMHIAQHFEHVFAFEPVPHVHDCFRRNVKHENVTLLPYALGERAADVDLVYKPQKVGGSYIKAGGNVRAQMRTLDSFAYENVDLIKIDTEGYEHLVLEGAMQTILKWKPNICIEQRKKVLTSNYGINDQPGLTMLYDLGMVLLTRVGSDFMLGWKE